jgi:hypothetical protein
VHTRHDVRLALKVHVKKKELSEKLFSKAGIHKNKDIQFIVDDSLHQKPLALCSSLVKICSA